MGNPGQMTNERKERPTRLRPFFNPHFLTLATIGAVLLGFAVALLDALRRFEKFQAESAVNYLYFRFAVLLLGLACLAILIFRLRYLSRPLLEKVDSWLPLRVAIYVIFLAIAATTLAHVNGLFQESVFPLKRYFENALLVGLGLWALLMLTRPLVFAGPLRGVWSLLDVAFINLVVIMLLLEGVVSLWARYSDLPFFWNVADTESNIERFRREPNAPYFNFAFNSLGYNDTEFFRAEEGDFVVALLADSFGVGVVPYDYNFATVAERQLQAALQDRYERMAVHNFGIMAIGIPEYAYLLQNEVLDTNPTRVVLAVFVGNDIGGLKPNKGRRASFMNWWVVTLARRIWASQYERKHGTPVATIGSAVQKGGLVPEFIGNPIKEKPTYTDKAFLEIERDRMNVLRPGNRGVQRQYQRFFRALDLFDARLGDRLLVVLIPDEFQVNDALYQRLLATKDEPDAYDRALPQRLILEYAGRKGISVLDLLPVLREAEKQGRTYHLRDTHWNARGNRVAGEAIADFILRHGP